MSIVMGKNTSFYIATLNCKRKDVMKGEIGRLLVCGNRSVPMNDDEIKNVHAYLMEEWNINKKTGARGSTRTYRKPWSLRATRSYPKGDAGVVGPAGPQGNTGPRGAKGEPGT